jgi:hypothetical protein
MANQIPSVVKHLLHLLIEMGDKQRDHHVAVQPCQVLLLAQIVTMLVLQLAQLTLPLLASLLLNQVSTTIISKHGKSQPKTAQVSPTPTLLTSQLV